MFEQAASRLTWLDYLHEPLHFIRHGSADTRPEFPAS